MLSELEQKQLDSNIRFARSERYACQSVAKKALPDERVSICLRLLLNKLNLQVWKHRESQKAFYDGLAVCGSVWHCPVCASKIAERRRKEVKQAFMLHKDTGGKIALLTLTFSHKITDKLGVTLKKFTEAMQVFMRGKRFDNIRKKLDLIGRIRVFEVTYGSNGFHPHAHIALFYNNDVDLDAMRNELFGLWQKACQKVGLDAKEKYGLSLEDGEKANDYLAKHGTWGLDQEMTKAHTKKAKKNSLTPFDFLRKYLETDEKKYLNLFREYAYTFKGKKQLHWSRGLKKQFLIDDKTDEQVAKEKTEDADLMGLITYKEWKDILRYKKRSNLLDYVERYGFEYAVMVIKDEINSEKEKNKNAYSQSEQTQSLT